MAELIYPTNESVTGPWLIDREDLEALDDILDQEWNRLIAHIERMRAEEEKGRAEETEQDIQRTIKQLSVLYDNADAETLRKKAVEYIGERSYPSYLYPSRTSKRLISIYLREGKRIEVTSFEEARRHPELLGEIPHRFDIRLECGEVNCNMSLTHNLISLRTSPESLSEARESFVSLRQWVATVAPPKWLHYWKKGNGLQWLIWILAIIIIVSTASTSKDQAKKAFQEKAHELLKDGLTQEEQLKATEILLALQSEYVPSTQNTGDPGWFLFLVFGGFVMCIASSILPNSVLGIGKGQDRIKAWRKWFG